MCIIQNKNHDVGMTGPSLQSYCLCIIGHRVPGNNMLSQSTVAA